MNRLTTSILAASLFLVPAVSQAEELALGDSSTTTSSASPAELTYTADAAGLLVVVAQCDSDIFLVFLDGPNEVDRVDRDYGGQQGVEAGTFVVPRPGSYSVRIECYGGDGDLGVEVNAAFHALPQLERAPDPDHYPTGANELTLGTEAEDSVDPDAGDDYDFYKVTAAESGTLTIEVWADGDVNLTTYSEEDLSIHLEYIDDDIDGDYGHERATIEAEAGVTYYVKVAPLSSGAAYRIVAN